VTETSDRWHRWLLEIRHGGDVKARERDLAEFLYPVRDKVLEGAELQPGETLLDVGVGDGLIAFEALERLGPSGRVIFSDISKDLLDHCHQAAKVEGLVDRCSFVLAAADSLDGIADASVDVVTTRSVLIYVKDKAAAFREFYRVLRSGGRISLFEPINKLMADCDPGRFWGYDVSPVASLAAKVDALYESIQPRGKDPMGDFDERDLVGHAEEAGFPTVKLELHLSVKNTKPPVPWERFLRTSGNPLIPATGEAIERTLDLDEIAAFTAHLKPLVESGIGQDRTAFAYLTAAKTRDEVHQARTG
jgi:ubiquinone/menaquinone biosynthesis C-methylase UbiE